MTKNKDKRYPVAIDDLLIEFDEMNYCPMNLSGDDPVKEAIAWRDRLRYELDLLLDEKSAIERRAVEEFAQKIKDGVADYLYKTNFDGRKDNVVDMFELCEIVDKVVKEYEAGEIENAQTAATEEEKGVVNDKPFIGKFKSVDALYRAYERLEAEFTRRSQRLKALEASAQRNTDENNERIGRLIRMTITNKDFYKRYRNFSGSFFEWFRACVNENDVFRFWYKGDPEDANGDYVKISSVIDIGGDFLLGLKFVNWNGEEEGQEMVEFIRLSEVRTIEIFANEEDLE